MDSPESNETFACAKELDDFWIETFQITIHISPKKRRQWDHHEGESPDRKRVNSFQRWNAFTTTMSESSDLKFLNFTIWTASGPLPEYTMIVQSERSTWNGSDGRLEYSWILLSVLIRASNFNGWNKKPYAFDLKVLSEMLTHC